MTYAFSHLHAGWHAIIAIGGGALWLLSVLMQGAWVPSGVDNIEAEKRSRERIMESFDKQDKRDDDK
jgi:hypothetical protein